MWNVRGPRGPPRRLCVWHVVRSSLCLGHRQTQVPKLKDNILKMRFLKGEYFNNFMAKKCVCRLKPEAIHDKNGQI